MKNVMMRISTILAMIVIFALVVGVSSCKKSSDPVPDPVIVLDGYYVTGSVTAYPDFNANAMMKVARNEVTQTDLSSLLELYLPIKAGAAGFSIVKVAGSARTTYGPMIGFGVVANPTTDEPKVPFQRGAVSGTSTTKFTVPEDGFYHVVFDFQFNVVAIMRVHWGVIGAATPNGWGASTELPESAFNATTMSWTATDMVLTKADFKFRYSDGWKVEIDTSDADPLKWVKVNTNFGGAVGALVAGGANITNAVPGLYTVKMAYTLGSGYVATLTKTGELNVKDYTNTELGLVGDGLFVGGVQQTWDVTIMLSKPVVENVTNYTWTYNQVDVSTVGSFKIREGQDWTKKSIGYNDVTMAGLAADKFGTNADGNFVPLADGKYDMVLKIDAVTEKYTFTVNPSGAAPEMYMLGDGCSAGWDNTLALPMTGSNGIYSLTTTLGASKSIKFITTLGQWAPMYGTDASGTSTAGNLVYRATESDPDPASLPTPATEGKYVVTININTLTYTISPALYMLGDGCAAGWDNTAALPMGGGANGVYTLTTTLGAAKSIKFITTLGAWAPMYGTNASGTNTGGPLVFRPTEADPDPTNIPTPAAEGKYTVTADITSLTYTIVAK